MTYYVRYQDLKKDRRAPDLSKVIRFCKAVVDADRLAEKVRKQK